MIHKNDTYSPKVQAVTSGVEAWSFFAVILKSLIVSCKKGDDDDSQFSVIPYGKLWTHLIWSLPGEDLAENVVDPLLIFPRSSCVPSIETVEFDTADVSATTFEEWMILVTDFLYIDVKICQPLDRLEKWQEITYAEGVQAPTATLTN